MRRLAVAGGPVVSMTLAVLAGSASAQTPEVLAPEVLAPEVLVRAPDAPLLIEGVARGTDASLILSSVHGGRLYRAAADGTLAPFGPEGRQAIFGIAADPARGLLWAAEAPTAFDDQADRATALLMIDLASGALLAEYAAPGDDHMFGDVAVGPDGTAYVADGKARRILVVRPGSTRLELLLQAPERASLQGMAVSPDGRWLVYSDYRSGLHRLALSGDPSTPAAEEFRPLPTPEDVDLRGLDGLARQGGRIVAIQNGTQTQRVLRLTLAADWSAVVDREALVEGPPLEEPTTGFVEGDAFVFVSRSQWPEFDAGGQPKSTAPAGAVVSRLALTANP